MGKLQSKKYQTTFETFEMHLAKQEKSIGHTRRSMLSYEIGGNWCRDKFKKKNTHKVHCN